MEAAEWAIESATPEPVGNCALLDDGTLAPERTVTVCVVCCSTPSMSSDVIHAVTRALSSVATVRAVVLSDSVETLVGVDVVAVAQGTKLSKIRRLAALVDADLICICDPDMRVDAEACRLVFGRAAAEFRRGSEVIAFGIVEGINAGSLLSRVIALDKWLSHRVLRRLLWACGIGITLPGQFLIASARLLRSLDPGVDSYLDDLYLGWVARTQRVRVHRVPVVVGKEEPRTTWGSLLTQRLRWMKGLACLFRHLGNRPSAAFLLTVHFLAYHGLPISVLLSLSAFCIVSPLAAAAAFAALVFLLARCSGHSIWTAATFLVAFPAVHCLATLLWWIPASRSYLVRR